MVESGVLDTGRMPAAKLRFRVPAMLRSLPVLATSALAASLLLAILAAVMLPGEPKGGARAVAAAVAGPIVYHVFPDFIADLKTSRTRAHYVQLAAVVEVPEESVGRLREAEPRIVADVQACLRDLQRQDLAGAAGIERLRGILVSIIDQHIAPANARKVLFTRFLVD